MPTASSRDDPIDGLRVRALVERGPYYVGQAIALDVVTTAAGEWPEVVPPRVEGAEVAPWGTDFEPVAVDAIGDLVNETNRFTTRFRLVPTRPGRLAIPSIVARLGDRSRRSKPFRLDVRPIPAAGRPATFLGGVGPFELAAEARPSAVRVGQPIEFRLTITGPGALGTARAPELRGLERTDLGLEVARLPTESVAEPPARVLRYRLRPTKAGASAIPPVSVATFDPTSRRFLTRASHGVPIRVADVPTLDPSTLDAALPPERPSRRWTRPALWACGVASSLGLAAAVVLALARWRRRRFADPRRLAGRLARSFDPRDDAQRAARRVRRALTDYLRAAVGRPPGALTPAEASAGIRKATGDADLAARAERLVAACDRVNFAMLRAGKDIGNEARKVFESLARAVRPEGH
ncbi:MAG TPA: hypothetical protein VG406_27755 [Isosphaeraceae bacterium]|jgi:hypothetical protein|nr:hypothetical protein [Isosphaeraceae bacterium]